MLIKSPLTKKTKSNTRRKKASKRKKRSIVYSNAKKKTTGKGAPKKEKFSLPTVKPWKVILGAIIMGALGVLYLNHVFATEQLLQEVQHLEQQYEQANRIHNDYKLSYERMIGPAEIYELAKKQGLVNGGPAEKVIEVEK